jgi:hypothetical protein
MINENNFNIYGQPTVKEDMNDKVEVENNPKA